MRLFDPHKAPGWLALIIGLPTLLGMIYATYSGYRAYELRGVNMLVLECQVQELRYWHGEGVEIDFECWRIVLEHAGLLPAKSSNSTRARIPPVVGRKSR